MPTSVAPDDLFDPAFLESLEAFRIVARQVPKGGRFAEHRSRDLGTGIEFRDYRPYAPGDDLRAIDWNIYRRLGRVFLRLFEEVEDLPLYLLTDVSESLWLEDPPRAKAALRTALALAAISLDQHDPVGLYPFADDLRDPVRPRSGRRRVLDLANHLAAVRPGGPTDFGTSFRRFSSLRLRRGLAVVVSDFFDPAGAEAVIGALKGLRHSLLMVQVTRASDREPGLLGDLRLTDCESGHHEDVSVTPPVLERYRAAYDRFQEALTGFARLRGAGLLRVDADRPVVAQLAALFEGGRYVA